MVTEGTGTSSAAASAAAASSSSAQGSQERGPDPFTVQDPWARCNNLTPHGAESVLDPGLGRQA
eukprot:3767054-Lingulodinium_polyedra.AAC.1